MHAPPVSVPFKKHSGCEHFSLSDANLHVHIRELGPLSCPIASSLPLDHGPDVVPVYSVPLK